MNTNRKLILYIAASLDGYIAQPNDDLSFLNLVAKENEDYGYSEFTDSVDTVILGRKTYSWVVKETGEFSHSDKKAFIITRSKLPQVGNITFYNGDLNYLIERLKSESGKNIFLDGGAEIVNEFLKLQQIDEIILSIIPILLGGGTRLFNQGFTEHKLKLISSKSFDTGLVQLHYQIIR
jgi:dihydrofolate reductase